MDDQGVQKQMAEMYSERFKSTFDESCVNREQLAKVLANEPHDPDVPLYKQDIDDNLELWVNGLKVKDVRQETIECMPS